MCGISGIYTFKDNEFDRNKLIRMNSVIHHRGPDGYGIYAEGKVGIGSTRLSIIDLQERANMPLDDFDNRYIIVYNGEIFNYIEIKNSLLSKGYKFKTTSDTEVILNAYKEWGDECQHKFNGMWAFAIWDKKEKALFCSRDRYGIKPFYYYLDDKIFIFASEIKQLIDYGIDRQVNDNIIYDYLVFNFIDHTSETFFKFVNKLQPGHMITIAGNKFKEKKWYKLEEKLNNEIDENSLYKEFYDILYDSVRIRLRSDVEVGSCLSGGLDSSTIVCAMHDILHNEGKPENQKTYTAAYDLPELDERKYVESVIEKTHSTKYYLFPDADGLINDMDKMFYHQDEPFTSLSIYAQYCVFKKIHETKLKVVLDGQGADEILLGYSSFYPFYLNRFKLNPVRFFNEMTKGAEISGLGYNKFAQNYIYFNSPNVRYRHVRNNASQYLNIDFSESTNRKELFYNLIGGDLKENRFSNLWHISLPSLLRYEDKNSMAFSVEARLPFLDHRLVELIFTIPYDLLINNGWTKFTLRQATKGKIPEKVRMRKGKLAFSVPQKLWMNKLSEYIINDITGEFLSKRFIDSGKLFDKLASGRFNEKVLFRVFSIEKWMRIFDLK